jgi:hypothetical protein
MPNKIIVDQISTSGGQSFSFPSSDGTSGQYLKTDGSGNLSFITLTAPATPTDNIAPPESALVYGSIYTESARQNGVQYSSYWTTSGPYTTYRHEYGTGYETNSTNQAWNMFLGDGYPDTGSTGSKFWAGDYNGHAQRRLQFANNQRTGHAKFYKYQYNGTSYGGCTWRVMPIRNTTNSPITTTVYFEYISYSTYAGASCGYFTPSGTGTLYSQQTGGTWSSGFTTSSTNGSFYNPDVSSMSVTVPANTTVLVMLNTTHAYYTTYRFYDANAFYNLSTTFSTGLVCDLRMLYALQHCRSVNNTYSTAYPHQIYNACAVSYGDR